VQQKPAAALARRLGLFDATMIVMGGIIGSGIFMNPRVVAQQVHTPALILGAWVAGGLIALAGAFIYAELAALRPRVGGQYAYIREAYHPSAAFVYGWALLLVIQTGGMAAVAVTFARYFAELAGTRLGDKLVAAVALAVLTGVNSLGVRAGSTVQSVLMVLKIVAILALIAFGLFAPVTEPVSADTAAASANSPSIISFGAAMVPVLFAYGGWQTANFIAGEMREPRKNLPRGLLIGVAGVVALYLSVNFVCVRVLGVEGLAAAATPASAVMRIALGETGARLIAIGITISTLGFLSQSILTAPRVYYAMAEDGLFFKHVGWVQSRTRVPVIAIALQGALAIVIALSGRYEQILNYVVSADFLFFGLTATCLFVFRRREAGETGRSARSSDSRRFRVPGHPATTIFFVAASWLVVINTVYKYPENTLIGLAIVLSGIPAYLIWSSRRTARLNRERPARSGYMEWAKTRSQARYNLATSGVAHYPISELPVTPGELELSGDSYYGYGPLQLAIARKCDVTPDCVVAANGTSMANHLVMAATIRPGDEVVIESPTYELLVSTARYLGADVRMFHRRFEDGFALDPERLREAITGRTRLIVITNLHNPSGAFAEEDLLREVGAIAGDAGAKVLVDEVYLDALFDKRPGSAFHLGDEFITTNSLTKVYGLSGLRCGWILARPEMAERIWKLNDLFGVIPPHPAELLSVIALANLDRIAARARSLIETNTRLVESFFDSRDDLRVVRPIRGTTCFPSLLTGRIEGLCALMREKYDVSVVPGRFFGLESHFRLGLGGDTRLLKEGLDRLGQALDELRTRP
jgi:APA family basic amino acid/polyamine antiporter